MLQIKRLRGAGEGSGVGNDDVRKGALAEGGSGGDPKGRAPDGRRIRAEESTHVLIGDADGRRCDAADSDEGTAR